MIEAGAKLSGKVWLDLNRDRLHQGGERPLAGWRAQLLLPHNDPAARGAGCATWSPAPARSTA